jgi:hypothetical protein
MAKEEEVSIIFNLIADSAKVVNVCGETASSVSSW